jgi:hypothetical protein
VTPVRGAFAGSTRSPRRNPPNVVWQRLVSTMQCIGLVMLSKHEELRDRVEARRHDLLKKFNELKADTRHEAIEARAKVKQKLDELELHLKGGWEKLSDSTRSKLDQWLGKD